MSLTRKIAGFLVAVAVMVPQIVVACPQCAAREGAGIGGVLLLGGMILSPFVVAYLTWRSIRRITSPADNVEFVGSEIGGQA